MKLSILGCFLGLAFGLILAWATQQFWPRQQIQAQEYSSFPLGEEQSGMLGASTEVSIITKVVKDGDDYLYSYKLKNIGKRGAYCGWELMDLASYNGHGVPLMWHLDPGEEVIMTLKHSEAPVLVKKWAYIWNKSDKVDKWDEHFAEAGVKMPPTTFHHRASFGHPGPIPKSYLTKKN